MARGAAEEVGLVTARRGSARSGLPKPSDEVTRTVPSQDELTEILSALEEDLAVREGSYPAEGFRFLQQELTNLRKELSESNSSLERLFAWQKILRKRNEIDETILSYLKDNSPKDIAENLDSMEARDLIYFYCLETTLPFLDIESQSMRELKRMLSKDGEIDVREQLYDDWRNDKDYKHNSVIGIIRSLALSAGDPQVEKTERIVRKLFPLAQETSKILTKRSENLPLVLSEKAAKLILPGDSSSNSPGGMCYAGADGFFGEEPTFLFSTSGEIKESGGLQGDDEEVLFHIMVHEMIHDTQEGLTTLDYDEVEASLDYPAGEDALKERLTAIRSFNEALTDSLTIFRTNNIGLKTNYTHYAREAYAITEILRKAGVRKEEMEDRLTYLNNIPVLEAERVLSEWLGEDNIMEIFLSLRDSKEEGGFLLSKETEDLLPLK
jgi:hypothetical protein